MIVTRDYAVIGIIDGDTLVIEGKNKVRLRQTNAPELEFCGGQEAKLELEKLVKGKRVQLENELPDPWGRDMAIVFVDGKMVNKEMIKNGFARYYHDTTPYEEELKNAQVDAEKNKLGIFAKCETPTNLEKPECIIKGNIRARSNSTGEKTRIYYLPNCAQYKTSIVSLDLGERWFCTEQEAKAAGYVKAETCK